jgi:hypothetical protein
MWIPLQHDMMGYCRYATLRIVCDVPFVGKRWYSWGARLSEAAVVRWSAEQSGEANQGSSCVQVELHHGRPDGKGRRAERCRAGRLAAAGLRMYEGAQVGGVRRRSCGHG